MKVNYVVYVGKPKTKKNFANSVFIEGVGWVDEYSIRYGMTGWCVKLRHGRFHFVSSEVNVCFILNRKELYFPNEISKA